MGGVCLIVLLNGHPSTGCPAADALPVDSASLDALIAGRDVCGDAEN